MKTNTTITTRILAEFDMLWNTPIATNTAKKGFVLQKITKPTHSNERIQEFLKEALSRQREEIVKQLRMEPDEACEECAMAMSHLMASVCGHHKTAAKNKLIIEFNRKLEELNV